MTNYLASGQVQQVSITIANGSLTGTATINSVGSGAFIAYQGVNPTDTADLADTMVYITISGTTITATRGITGTNQSVVLNATIVDGDTTVLINSVQFVSATIANGAATKTNAITAVTTANTAVYYLGSSPSASQTSLINAKMKFNMTTTTNVTASRSGTTGAMVYSFCVVQFQSTALTATAVQLINSTAAVGTSKNNTITGITTANTMLVYSGFYGTNAASEAVNYGYAQLTSTTNVSITWNTSQSGVINYILSVVEFVSGVLAQMQRGTKALSAATSAAITITSSTAATTVCSHLGNSSTATSLNPANSEFAINQSSATNINLTANASATGTASWEAPQFTTSGGGFTAVNRRTIGPRVGSRSYY